MRVSNPQSAIANPQLVWGGVVRLAPEGWPFILPGWALVVLGAWVARGSPWVWGPEVALFLLAVWLLIFFRDPVRTGPRGDQYVIAPADGKIVDVRVVDEPMYLKTQATRISIFMNVFDVHVNRYPATGTVELVRYYPGRFLHAGSDKASLDNAQASVGVRVARRVLSRRLVHLLRRRARRARRASGAAVPHRHPVRRGARQPGGRGELRRRTGVSHLPARVRGRRPGGVDFLLLLRHGGGHPAGALQHHSGRSREALLHRTALAGRRHDARDVLSVHDHGAGSTRIPLHAAPPPHAAPDHPAHHAHGEQRALRDVPAGGAADAQGAPGARHHPVYPGLRDPRARRVFLPAGDHLHGVRHPARDAARFLLRGGRRRNRHRRPDRDR